MKPSLWCHCGRLTHMSRYEEDNDCPQNNSERDNQVSTSVVSIRNRIRMLTLQCNLIIIMMIIVE